MEKLSQIGDKIIYLENLSNKDKNHVLKLKTKIEKYQAILNNYEKKLEQTHNKLDYWNEKKEKMMNKRPPVHAKYKHLKILKGNYTLNEKIKKIKEVLPLEKWEIINNHFNKIFEHIQDDFDSLKKEKIIDISNIKYNIPDDNYSKNEKKQMEINNDNIIQHTNMSYYLKAIEQIVYSIFCCICLNSPDNVENLFYNFTINNGTFVNNLNTKENVYYLTKDIFVKIHTVSKNYAFIQKFIHPLNFLFYRNVYTMDYFIFRTKYNTCSFKFDKAIYNRILKNEVAHVPIQCKKFNYFKKLDTLLKKEDMINYNKLVSKYSEILGDFKK